MVDGKDRAVVEERLWRRGEMEREEVGERLDMGKEEGDRREKERRDAR